MQPITNIVDNFVQTELDGIPSIPAHIRMRLTGLLRTAKQKPHDTNLKIDLFHLATSHLYSTIPVPSNIRLVFIGDIIGDGVGDYYHLLNGAETSKNKCDKAKITIIANQFIENIPSSVRKPIDPDIEIIFCKKEVDVTPDYSHIQPLLQNVDQIIEMSVESSIVDFDFKKDSNKYVFIGEYGVNIYEHNRFKKSMGVTNCQLGIVIKEKPQNTSLRDLENEKLKNILFKTASPSEKDLETYLSTHEPYIGYLKAGSYYQMAFIYTAIALQKDKQIIDLIIPEVKNELNEKFLKEQGIGKVSTIKIKNGEIVQSELLMAENGKELRLISPFPLDQKDFYTLLMNTNSLVGCTGDHSFSEAISFDRLPFYELRTAKRCFLTNLIALAERVGNPPYYLKQYLRELFNIYDQEQEGFINVFKKNYDELGEEDKSHFKHYLKEFKKKQWKIAESSLKIAALLQQPEIILEFDAFSALLRTQYSFNPSLINIVERGLALNTYPDLKKLENDLQNKYLDGRVTIIHVINEINEKINNLKLS